MHREGDIIHFDKADQKRWPELKLEDGLPVEAVQDLLGRIAMQRGKAQGVLGVANDLPVTAHYRQHNMAAANRQLVDLDVLENLLNAEVPEGCITAQLDTALEELAVEGLDLSRLHEE